MANKDTLALDSLQALMNNNSFTVKNNKLQMHEISVNDLKVNKFNKAEMSNIEELTQSINTYGIQTPIIAYQSDNSYTLMNGHRRLLALQGTEIDTVPVILIDKPSSEIEERKLLLLFNAQRTETTDNVNSKILEIEELYQMEKEQTDMPLGAKSDYISDYMTSILGVKISSRTVDTRLKDLGKTQPRKEVKEKIKEEELLKLYSDFFKKVNKLMTDEEYVFEDTIRDDLEVLFNSIKSDYNGIEWQTVLDIDDEE